ncbi:MAG: LTA synthase family protein [Nitrospinae bacterium]|nr:LTA synthase family protein [Nitrospinota bacterium]
MTRLRKSFILVLLSLAVFTAARMALYVTQRESFSALSALQVFGAFVAGVRFDLSIMLTFFALPLVMLNLPVRAAASSWWMNLWGWLAFTLLLAAQFLLAGDVAYFGEVRRHTTTELMVMGNDWHFLTDMALGPYLAQTAALALFSTGLLHLWYRALHAAEPEPARRTWGRFLFLAVLLFIGIRGSFGDKSLNIVDAFTSGDTAYGNLSLNGAFTAYHSSRASKRVNHAFLPPEEARKTLGLGAEPYPLLKSLGHKQKTGYNIVFVLMESWGYKYVDSFAHNNYGVTPFFDQLAAKGIKFTHFYATGQRSVIGIQSTLTGVPPVPGMPTIGNGLEAANVSRLAAIAQHNGYATIFAQSSKRRSFRMDAVAKALGFAEYYGMEDMRIILDYPDKLAAGFGWDFESYMLLKERLDKTKQPFFAYLFTGSTHTPYPRPGALWEKRKHDPNNENGFLNMLYYSDWSLGQFMEQAKSQPWFANTIFVFTADHAQVHYAEGADFLDLFHTPLLIYAPGIFKDPKTVETIGSQLDIMPTLMDLLGFNDEFAAMGAPLFSKQGQYAFITEGDVIGIINDKGFLKHSLKNRLEAKCYNGPPPPGYFDGLEKRLLAEDQLTYELLKANRWAR